jgi:eukaryotic-like serine/threonine-protein kinase
MSERAEETWRAPGDRQAQGGSPSADCPLDTWRSQSGLTPELVDLAALSEHELCDRLCEDQVKRWRAGQRVPAESYLARHPRLEESAESALELIYGEFLLREEMGESPQLEEFRWRFPPFAARLQKQLDLHGALMAFDSTTGDRPDVCAADGVHASPPAPGLPRVIAPGFQILGELGRGGMGAVYKAWQVRLKRIVALKVIRADTYADSGAAARFLAEAEAAARLQHPNIVPVFEVGEYDGMGYLVLEYEAGGGLDRRLAGMLQNPDDSARLIESLARAIHHAHQHGIVHRDLKPANVLLTEDGIPKISDFGLAKLLERDDGLTQVGDILGTPSYMAPEQIRGSSSGITPATDVYALGAILYEMLTGRPPFKGTTPLSTMEQVSSIEPLSPGKLQRHTPRDLEIICLKCLQKEPRRRYASAVELGDDLRRFLDRKPILARRTPAWERAWKWARRRPSAATACLSTLIAIVLLLSGAVYYNARLRAAVRIAQHAEQASRNHAKAAFEERNLALQVFKELVYGVQEKLGHTPATRAVRQGLLDTAIAGLEEISQRTAGSPPDLSQAAAHQKLGDMYRIIGRYGDAGRHYTRSRELAEDLLARDADNIAIADVLYQTRMGLGLLNMATEQYALAKPEFERAATIAAVIAAAQPGHDAGRHGLIEAYFQIGRAHSFQHEFVPAETWFRKMQALAAAWVDEEPANHQARDLLASSLRKLADLKKFSKNFAGARQDYMSAITIGRELVQLEPLNFEFKSNLSIALDDLAGVVRDQADFEAARPLFQEAARLFAELVESDPDHLQYRTRLLHTQLRRAAMERDLSQFTVAAELFRAALDQQRRLERDGRLENPRAASMESRTLEHEIAFCAAAPRALIDLGFARTGSVVVRARLLLLRARTLVDHQVAVTARSIRELKADQPDDQYDVARCLGQLMNDLDSGRWPELSQPARRAIGRECADRAAEMLDQAVKQGFRDVGRLESDDFAGLRQHPVYRSLLARLKRLSDQPKPPRPGTAPG